MITRHKTLLHVRSAYASPVNPPTAFQPLPSAPLMHLSDYQYALQLAAITAELRGSSGLGSSFRKLLGQSF